MKNIITQTDQYIIVIIFHIGKAVARIVNECAAVPAVPAPATILYPEAGKATPRDTGKWT
ncbi:MAG: hypothetical protein ACRDE2_00550 [Chitinophagaceae bacterium]